MQVKRNKQRKKRKDYSNRIILILICLLSVYFIASKLIVSNATELTGSEKTVFEEKNLLDSSNTAIKKISRFLPENNIELVPCGLTIGLELKTGQLVVIGIGTVPTDKGEVSPAEGKLKRWDIITKINGKEVSEVKEFKDIVENSEGEITFTVKRDDNTLDIIVEPEISNLDGKRKLGIDINESTEGIGTVTYYHPYSKKFGALGHEIIDDTTKYLLKLKEGTVHKFEIGNIAKAGVGYLGELKGTHIKDELIGEVTQNTELGVFGKFDKNAISDFPNKKMKVGKKEEIRKGPARILSNIEGKTIEEYDIVIEKVDTSTGSARGIELKITDTRLLEKTNGIVQGMSGSPIIQDGKIIGAVTHVIVTEPNKGYGTFIENMLKQEQ